MVEQCRGTRHMLRSEHQTFRASSGSHEWRCLLVVRFMPCALPLVYFFLSEVLYDISPLPSTLCFAICFQGIRSAPDLSEHNLTCIPAVFHSGLSTMMICAVDSCMHKV